MADVDQNGAIPFEYDVVTPNAPQGAVTQNANPVLDYDVVKKGPPPPRPFFDGVDVAKSAGTGILRGAVGLVDTALTGGRGQFQDLPEWDSSKTKEENFAAMRPAMEAGARPVTPMGDLYQEALPEAMNYEPTSTAGGYMQTIAEFGSGMLFPAGKGGMLTRAARNVVAPAVTSETAGLAARELFPDNEAAEAYARLIGAFGGGPLGSVMETGVRAASGPAKQGSVLAGLQRSGIMPKPKVDPMIDALNRNGVTTTAGNVSRNPNLLAQEAQAPRTADILGSQPIQFRDAALKKAGIAIPDESQTVFDTLENARKASGTMYSRVTQGLNIVPSRLNMIRMRNIINTYGDDVPSAIVNIQKAVENSFRNGTPISPKQLGLWRSTVSAATRSSSPFTRQTAIETVQILDDIVGRSLAQAGRADDIRLLGQARAQYRDVLAVEGALMKAGKLGDEGMFTPLNLVNSLSNQGKTAFMRGKRGELGELARAGRARLTPIDKIETPKISKAGRIIGGLTDAAAGYGGYLLGNKLFPDNPLIAGTFGPTAAGASMGVRSGLRSAYRNILASDLVQRGIKNASANPASGASPIIGGVVGATSPRIERKSGGRVGSHDAEADRLVMAAERAKKGLSAHTEGLLNTSDDAVASALEIANRSI